MGKLLGRFVEFGDATTTSLAAAVLPGDTSLTVEDGSGFPASDFQIYVTDGGYEEIIHVDTRTGDTFSDLTRGQETNGDPAAHPFRKHAYVTRVISASQVGTGEGGGSSAARNVGQTELDFAGLVVNNAIVQIPFTFGDGDETMIDLAAPTVPLPVEAGIYAYTLIVNQSGGGEGGAFLVSLVVDDDYYSITARVGHEAVSVSGGVTGSTVVISTTWFCTAGSAFHASVSAASNDTYGGNLYVQKIA